MKEGVFTFSVGKLTVAVYPSRRSLGKAAGQAVASRMKELLGREKEVSLVFAAAPSQNEFLEELRAIPGIDWNRVVAFHLDEYIGLPAIAPQGFGNFLRSRLFEEVRPGQVHYLNGGTEDLKLECERYGRLLREHPLDIACIGIGENGHIAFNDPPVADFDDPRAVKVVELDPISRQQQVHDGCFQDIGSVPEKALTLTVPSIFSARFIFCMVPAPSKAEAVVKMLRGAISTQCPASILRRHENAVLFLDPDSASKIGSKLGGSWQQPQLQSSK